MSSGTPPKGPSKPFLAGDDLLAELDAWDSTFDALHSPDELAAAGATASEGIAQTATDGPAAHFDEGVGEIENQLSLERAAAGDDAHSVEAFDEPGSESTLAGTGIHARIADDVQEDTFDVDPGETAFSDVGASGAPAALGSLLGPTPVFAPPELDDDEDDRRDERTRIAPYPMAPFDDERGEATRIAQFPLAALEFDNSTRIGAFPMPAEDEEEVFTSASRPAAPAPQVSSVFDDDVIALPPPPEPRRGPAIVRRVPLTPSPVAPAEGFEQATPPQGTDLSAFSEFSEQTRIIDSAELAGPRSASRSLKPTTPPPMEDDEYEVEIQAAGPVPQGVADVPSRPVARTAHVVRRTEATPRPQATPTFSPATASAPTQAPSPVPAGGEDDFSDVAASLDGSVPEPDRDPFAIFDELSAEASAASPLAGPSEAAGRPSAPELSFEEPADRPRAPVLSVEMPSDEPALGEPAVDAAVVEVAPHDDQNAGEAQLEPVSAAFEQAFAAGVARPMAQVQPLTIKLPTSVMPVVQISGRLATAIPVEVEAPSLVTDLAPIDFEAAARAWPEQAPLPPAGALDQAALVALEIYERELALLDDSAAAAALRIEAGRLYERLGDPDRARLLYDGALLSDPRATAALRGLRRLARASGDLEEAVRHLDAEIAVASALERRPLSYSRIDLLMASGAQDLARVAVGEVLDSAPSDVRALLAHLELTFLDGRAEEFGGALEQLAHAVTDPEFRAAVQAARGTLAAHHNDATGAARWFASAEEADRDAFTTRIGSIRQAVVHADGPRAGRALLEFAGQVEVSDPTLAAAAALRALHWLAPADPEGLTVTATTLAMTAGPGDPLIARAVAETAAANRTDDPAWVATAFAHWASTGAPIEERAHAAARAAELDAATAGGTRGVDLWGLAFALDSNDDYAAAQLRTAQVATEAIAAAIEVDRAMATEPGRERSRIRAAYALIAQERLDEAIVLLTEGLAHRRESFALTDALAEALAAAGRWVERAQLLGDLAGAAGEQLDRDLAQLRSAHAWEAAVGATAAGDDASELQRVTAAALQAWERVLEGAPRAPEAHAASLLLASRLGDRDVLAEILGRAQAAERSPWAAASLGLRRARPYGVDDAGRAEAVLRAIELPAGMEDPRRTVALMMAAARQQDLGSAVAALEERAAQLGDGATVEAATLRLRAAQLILDTGDATRATSLLAQVEQALPQVGVVSELLAAARSRAGDRPAAPAAPAARRTDAPGASPSDAFVRLVRDADLAVAQGDAPTALGLYQRALELRPADPLASVPLIRVATQLRESAVLASLAMARLRAAEEAGDGVAKAAAYEELAHIDGDLRSDQESAQVALESAAAADPTRLDLMHRLQRHYAASDQLPELIRLRRAELDALGTAHAGDRAALLDDLAALAVRDGRPEAEVGELHRAVLALAPGARLALMFLEASVRRGGFTAELATLEDQVASYFIGDPRAQAAFWTRAGETLSELGSIDAAVQRFTQAEAALPGYVPALAAWRHAALKGQLWVDVAEAARKQAEVTTDTAARAALFHFAGVALMDKALLGEQATAVLHKALEAEPRHRDAFVRLRILLEEDARHDELAQLLGQRLAVEDDATGRIGLHRALAELHRNFLSDRETAKVHYRQILESEPNDLHAHAAIGDIAWEQGAWQEAADALTARARLERQPNILKTLCFRLGLIYAERLIDVPLALKAFQRALTYQPDDENTLVRLADLATSAGKWRIALSTCERLVKNETDPDRRASHLHRVAKIFKEGFGDMKRAERALNLALDAAPANEEALAQLVQFYRDAGDLTSVRVHLNRVSGTMRTRAIKNPRDGAAYRVIARAMTARASAGVAGSTAVARAAAELASLLGEAGEPEATLLAQALRPDLAALLRPEADEVLFPRSVQVELRQLFTLLGDRLAKHLGVDLRPNGTTRGDRLRAKDHPAAGAAQAVASGLGFGEIDVYLSSKLPWVMAAEPTSPVSLVIGAQVAQHQGGEAIRFAAGAALKLAQASLGIPARLPVDELGVLLVSLLRVFQPEFPAHDLDADAVAGQTQKLRRLIPSSLLTEMRPYALAIDPIGFDHREIARDIRIAGLRAGLVASGSLTAGLRMLAAQAGVDVSAFLANPVAQGVISFALGEDHASLAR